jgi:hypothetical protein
MNSQNQSDLHQGRLMVQQEVPRWRILLATPFMVIGVWILGGKNIWLENYGVKPPIKPGSK